VAAAEAVAVSQKHTVAAEATKAVAAAHDNVNEYMHENEWICVYTYVVE
jgi:uncharacterized membrane protein